MTYNRPAGTGLTPEELAMLEEAEKHPIEYDEDCPKFTADRNGALTPEQIAKIKAAQKRHAAIDPACVNLTPEQVVNWHPVGGLSWEERARRMRMAETFDHEDIAMPAAMAVV